MNLQRLAMAATTVAALLSARAADAQTYINQQYAEPYVQLVNIPGITGVTNLTMTSADDGYAEVTLPFTFNFLGTNMTRIRVGSNGYFVLGTAATIDSATSLSNQAPGTATTPNNWIAPLWDDLLHPSTANARWGVIGTAPNRVVVVEAGPATRYSGSGGTLYYQVRLYEDATRRFEFRATGNPVNTLSATVGYEGAGGTPSWNPLACGTTCSLTSGWEGQVFSTFIATTPELTGSFGSFPRGAFPGESAEIGINLRNVGVDTATVVSADVYLSTDNVLDPSDALIGTSAPMDIVGGSVNVPTTVTATVPLGTPVGDYFLILDVDSTNRYTETNENDNVVVATGRFATAHDLSPTAITGPAGGNPGESIRLQLTVTTLGVPYAGTVDAAIYVSADQLFGANDTLVGTYPVTLTGTSPEVLTVDVLLPTTLTPGNVFPVAVLDPANAIVELSDTNNTVVGGTAFTVGSDFAIGSLTIPSQIAPGAAGSVTTRIASLTAPYNGAVRYQLWASADDIVDNRDANLGTFAVTFAAEPFLDDTQSVTPPANLAPGRYRIIAVVDPSNLIRENSEANNSLASATTFINAPDFSVATVTFTPATVEASDTVTVTSAITSGGLTYTGDVPYRIYFSPDATFDPADEPMFDGTVFVAGTASTPLTAAVVIPRNIAVRTFRVIIVVDPDGQIGEALEDNNAASSSGNLTVRGADLKVTSISAPGTGFIGLPYTVDVTIDNDGAASARAFRYAYYLSTNDIIRVTDTRIFVSETATIASGGSQSFTDTIELPTFTSTQTLYLGVILDIYSDVPETSEGNNIGRVPTPISIVFPIPDLEAEIVTTATAAAAGEELAVTRLLLNTGVYEASGFTYAYYLSSNPTISADDILVGTFTSSLDAGADDYGIDVLQIPATVSAGSYYLALVLDPANTMFEVDETNNTALGPSLPLFAGSIQFLTQTLPDATLGAQYQVGVYATGGPVGITWRVGSGALPPGLSIDPVSGLVSGTATEEGSYTFVLRAESGTAYAERSFTIRVLSPTVPLRVASNGLPGGVVGRDYEATLVAVGGATPYTWAAISQLPPGLELSEDGVLSGRPEAPGNVRVTVRVRDAIGTSASKELGLNLISADQILVIRQPILPTGVVGIDYCGQDTFTFEASGGVPPYAWSLISNAPPGMTFGEDGTLCGTPEEVGAFPFLIRVQDQSGLYDTSMFVLEVDGGRDLAIATFSLEDAEVEKVYTAELTAVRGDAPYTWSIVPGAGTLPAGITLDATTGNLGGTPTTAGLYPFTVQVIDAKKRVDLQPLSIAVLPKPVVKPTPGDGGCTCVAEPSKDETSWSGLALGLVGLGLVLRRRRVASKVAAKLGLVGLAAFAALAPSSAEAQFVPGTPYVRNQSAITYTNLSSPTVVFSSGDDSTSVVTLPFPFRYYDADVTQVAIGTNGAVSFDSGSPSISLSNSALGTTATPNSIVALFWDDQIVNSPATIGYQVDGSAPNRTFTIEYRNVSRFGSSGTAFNVQLRLFEGAAARLQVDYGTISGSATWSASMGMEDQSGARPILFAPSNCTTSCSSTDFAALSGQRIELVQDPGIELMARSVSIPPFGFIGAQMGVDVGISNLHGAVIGPFDVELRASTTADMANPVTIYSGQMTLPAFTTASVTLDAVAPTAFGEGAIYVGLYVDPLNGVVEANENNNSVISSTYTRLLEGKPDLEVQRVTTPVATATAGDTLPVSFRVKNIGGLPANNAEVAVMLSTNPVITPQDVELSRFTLTLGPQETSEQTINVTIPANTNSGRYYLGVFADATAAIDELEESNNGLATFDSIVLAGGQLTILTTQLPVGYPRAIYNGLLSAIGGGSTYTWRITQGTLPSGLGLVPSSGEIFGRPLQLESQTFTVEVESSGQTATKQLTLRVVGQEEPLTIVTRSLPSAIVGQEYSFELIATGGVAGSTLTWSATDLPAGMTMLASGTLGGTPEAVGSADITVTVEGGGQSATRMMTLRARDDTGLLIEPEELPRASFGVAYEAQLVASGGAAPLTWVLQYGQLPVGLTLATSGLISGTPMQVGRFRIVVEARDANPPATQARDSNTFEIVVDDVEGFTISTESLPDAIIDEGYDHTLAVTGGTAPISWAIVDGTLPDGITGSANPTTNEFRIVGQPTALGTSNLLFEATDSQGRKTTRALALRVIPKPVMIDETPTEDDGCGCTTAEPKSGSGLAGLLLLVAAAVVLRRKR
ncbi:putative Ig domain-containing protein [Myxococcota bacterium]|nr:putative Ig domain-containing protein [Myxococcota bacterium]